MFRRKRRKVRISGAAQNLALGTDAVQQRWSESAKWGLRWVNKEAGVEKKDEREWVGGQSHLPSWTARHSRASVLV